MLCVKSCPSSAELIYFLAALVPVTVSYALSTWSASRTFVPFILHPVNSLILFPEEYPDIVMMARLDENETVYQLHCEASRPVTNKKDHHWGYPRVWYVQTLCSMEGCVLSSEPRSCPTTTKQLCCQVSGLSHKERVMVTSTLSHTVTPVIKRQVIL